MDKTFLMDRLEKTSRVSSVLMALGAIVVLGALWLSYGQLRTLQAEVRSLESQALQLRTQNLELTQRAEATRNEIKGLREALTASRDAINYFHHNDYKAAGALYDLSLRADPHNAYLLNLKAYSLFKLKRLSEAIDTQNEGIRINPGYAWGFVDLARFQCEAKNFNGARESIKKALDQDDKNHQLRKRVEADGEFQRLCPNILK